MDQEETLTMNDIPAPGESRTVEKLWTPNFFILWQGQLISVLGDVVYSIALGFWVLAVTGSTALMGTLMAASTLPSVLIAPFAGVIVDRTDRRKLIILMDVIRGATIVLLATAAYTGFISIWMVFVAGIILSVGGAFFSPAVNSAIPDIVPPSKLMGANSMMGVIQSSSNIIGNSVGGFLFQLIGAPFLFLFNGVSFLVSAVINIFIKIPQIKRDTEQHFWADLRDGYKFIWEFRGLRYLLILASVLNFLSAVAITLFLPLFQRTEYLGAARYGVAMAFLTGGMLLAMVITSLLKVPPARRLAAFMISAIAASICFAATALTGSFPVMCAIVFVGGVFMAAINVFINATVQLTVPQDMRGKVFALIAMVASSLAPFGMALGGVLGEYFPLRAVIFTCFVLMIIVFLPFSMLKSFKRFINFDPERETLQDIL